jgi:glycosyltransferase involved in cell wall biosynthesis
MNLQIKTDRLSVPLSQKGRTLLVVKDRNDKIDLSKRSVKLAITIPAYNEEKSIGKVIREIPRKIEGIDEIEVIVINDGSTDRTSDVAKEAGADRIIQFTSNKGLAIAFKEGLNAAIDSGADMIVNTDADGQYNGLEIPKLIKPLLEGKADIVLGSRFSGTIEYMVPQKRWGNKIATFVVGFASGIKISDAQTGFRAISREAALKLVVHSGYTYTQETIIQASHKRLSITEIPVEFRRRDGDGQSRLISSVMTYAKRSAVTLIRTYTSYNPLKTFTYLGGAIFLIGGLFALKVLIHFILTGMVTPYMPTALLSSVMAIIGFQVIVIGLIADISHQNRHIMEEVLYRMRKGR